MIHFTLIGSGLKNTSRIMDSTLRETTPMREFRLCYLDGSGFRVHFYRLAFGGPRLVYTHNLESNEEGIRLLASEDCS